MWALPLPQVAARLAADLMVFNTVDRAGHRLIDQGLLNAVLVLMLVTAILGPVLTTGSPRTCSKRRRCHARLILIRRRPVISEISAT